MVVADFAIRRGSGATDGDFRACCLSAASLQARPAGASMVRVPRRRRGGST
jgi:hypothetical protein